jgi:MSHA pilin protein MshA
MVIVILGILAATALPKFADLSTQAEIAAADGVFGSANSAAAINFSAGLAGAAQPAGAAITTGTLLLAALDGTPEGWVPGTTTTTQICLDANTDADCTAADTYIITVATGETATAKAVLSKNW